MGMSFLFKLIFAFISQSFVDEVVEDVVHVLRLTPGRRVARVAHGQQAQVPGRGQVSGHVSLVAVDDLSFRVQVRVHIVPEQRLIRCEPFLWCYYNEPLDEIPQHVVDARMIADDVEVAVVEQNLRAIDHQGANSGFIIRQFGSRGKPRLPCRPP